MQDKNKFITIISAFLTVIIIGIFGYMNLLNINFIDALYMTTITISTVGYREVADMTSSAKIFSIFIIFSGLGVAGYGVTSIFALFFEGNFRDNWRRKRMESKIREMKNHYIVCGAGEIGEIVIQQFQNKNIPFIVIEEDEKQVEELIQNGFPAIKGDATVEDVLSKAGIEHAKGVICSLSSDADNVFTVLTAREMNKDAYIVSRAIEKNAHSKLKKAGANNTISPNEIGGRRMASLIIRPSVISFLDIITQVGDVVLDLEEVTICSEANLAGKTLKEARIPERTGLIVMAIKRQGSTTLRTNPSSDEILYRGDTMIVLGTQDQVDKLKNIACDI